MSDLYADNIAHHEQRAAMWMAKGNPEYAAGSLAKAAKWRARSRQFDSAMFGFYPKTVVASLLDERLSASMASLAAQFEEVLFNGRPA